MYHLINSKEIRTIKSNIMTFQGKYTLYPLLKSLQLYMLRLLFLIVVILLFLGFIQSQLNPFEYIICLLLLSKLIPWL